MFHKYKNQRGSVLVYTLLLLLSMSAVAFFLSTLTFREIRLTRTTQEGVQTLYAAESGLERTLDIVDEARADNVTLTDMYTKIASLQGALDASDVQYNLNNETTESLTRIRIPVALQTPEGYGIQVEMMDPSNPFALRDESADRVTMQWSLQDTASCALSRMEVSFQEISADTSGDGAIAKQIVSCDTPPNNAFDCKATVETPAIIQPDASFIFRARALECPMTLAEVAFVDDQGNTEQPVSLPGYFRIVVNGNGLFTQHIVRATMKWTPSASQLGDFVLFSVDKVEKGVTP